MSPVVDIQARFRELGRIRLGQQEETGQRYTSGPKKGQPKMRPVKLAQFRLTSPWPHLIKQAAGLYGGTAQQWDNDGTTEWEVITEHTDEHGVALLPIVIPTSVPFFDQWWELWTGAGLVRRCDGATQIVGDQPPCECPPDPGDRTTLAAKGQACRLTSRLRVMLPDLADLGTWRVETHSYHAGTQLRGVAALLEMAGGNLVPADLRLQETEGALRPGEPRRRFHIPVVSFRANLGPILESLGALTPSPALGSGADAALPAPAEDPTPRPQRSFIDDLYTTTDNRVRSLNDSDYSRLVSWCADQKPPVPLDGVIIDGARSTKTVLDLPQNQVHDIAAWLDALEALAAQPAEEPAP